MAPRANTPIGEVILWLVGFSLSWFVKWKFPRGITSVDPEKRKRAEQLAERLAQADAPERADRADTTDQHH
jgi:hypothetical protein